MKSVTTSFAANSKSFRYALYTAALIFAAVLFGAPAKTFAQTACYTAWNSSTQYSGGQTVSYNAENYTAAFWSQGSTPSSNSGGSGSGEPWTPDGSCGTSSGTTSGSGSGTTSGTGSGTTSGTGCYTVWSSSTAYNGGQTASYSGVNYTANWWTQGNNPSTSSGPTGSGQPWTNDGSCSGTSSGSGSGSGGTTPPATPPPSSVGHLYAPYVDMSLTPDENLVQMQQASGFKSVTLAFIVSTNGCSIGWGGLGGTLPTDNMSNGTSILSVVQSLQAAGVQVIISFGGATGTEPAVNCTSPSQLQAAYQSVITRYGVSMLDFDIEGGAVTNQASLTVRDQALIGLKQANPGLVLSYTLPVMPTGLIASGVNVLTTAKADGFNPDVINVMAMDYGSANDNGAQMGLDATDAASSTAAQIANAGLTSSVGITPMIGINDTDTEFFQLSDATTVLNFANANSYVSRIAIWSLARDNGSCAGEGYASPVCSGIAQSTYQFTSIFNAF